MFALPLLWNIECISEKLRRMLSHIIDQYILESGNQNFTSGQMKNLKKKCGEFIKIAFYFIFF